MGDLHARSSHGFDATSILTVYLCLLLIIPSPMVVGSLGSAGAPSSIMAVATLFWWIWFHIHRDRPVHYGFQPVRAAMILWLVTIFLAYANAMSSAIPFDEISVADSNLLKVAGFAGILFVANDGISGMDRLRPILRRMVIGAGLIALFGLIQYLTKKLYVDQVRIPGLTAGTEAWTLGVRGGFARASGTSTSPIEYGVVMTMILPLVITFAVQSNSRRWLYRIFLCAVTLAVFLSISRSTLLCALAGLVVLAFSWTTSMRLRALLFVGIAATAVYLMVPGVLGTLTRLFTGANEDPSIASRTGSYDIAWHFFGTSPIFGRGFGTFLPKYWILDNGYLGQLIEGGILGLLGLVTLVVTGIVVAIKARRLFDNEFDKGLAQGLAASITAGACGLAFFDTFSFPQSAGCFFLLLGLAGASWRIARAQLYRREASRRGPDVPERLTDKLN